MEPHLSDEFLDRVRRAYRLALTGSMRARLGWQKINARRADVHAALMTNDNSALRGIFANPTTTDLYFGMDNLCRSLQSLTDADNFVDVALGNNRGRLARYQVQRVLEILPTLLEPRAVIEIGPGMGRVAYLAFRAGITDYTTVDLPLGIVGQACFLGRALSPDALWFEGEEVAKASGRLKLRYRLPHDGRWALAFNADSMPEMPIAEAFTCACWLGSHAHNFLSINRMDAFQVSDVMRFAATGLCQERKPCSAWPGYTDELYAMRAATLPSLRFAALLAVHGFRYCIHPILLRLSIFVVRGQ